MSNSRISGLYKLSVSERINQLEKLGWLTSGAAGSSRMLLAYLGCRWQLHRTLSSMNVSALCHWLSKSHPSSPHSVMPQRWPEPQEGFRQRSLNHCWRDKFTLLLLQILTPQSHCCGMLPMNSLVLRTMSIHDCRPAVVVYVILR